LNIWEHSPFLCNIMLQRFTEVEKFPPFSKFFLSLSIFFCALKLKFILLEKSYFIHAYIFFFENESIEIVFVYSKISFYECKNWKLNVKVFLPQSFMRKLRLLENCFIFCPNNTFKKTTLRTALKQLYLKLHGK
jgi:hypothetical protein